MKENIRIRFIKEEDIEELISLVITSFNEMYLTASIYSCKGINKFIIDELENSNSPYRYFVAELNEKIVGFAEFKIFQETSCSFLNMIATDSKFKGQGIGNKIFTFAKEFFINCGFTNIQLDVFNSNSNAKNWYYSMGFNEEYTKSFYCYYESQIIKEDITSNLIINNYPNFKCQYNNFGFSFLEIKANNINVNLGIINNNGILRQNLEDTFFNLQFFNLLNKHGIKYLYYIGDDIANNNFSKMDEIIRMKLDI